MGMFKHDFMIVIGDRPIVESAMNECLSIAAKHSGKTVPLCTIHPDPRLLVGSVINSTVQRVASFYVAPCGSNFNREFNGIYFKILGEMYEHLVTVFGDKDLNIVVMEWCETSKPRIAFYKEAFTDEEDAN